MVAYWLPRWSIRYSLIWDIHWILLIYHQLTTILSSIWKLVSTKIMPKKIQKQSEAFHKFLWHFFPSLKQFIAYRSPKVSDCIFEIHQLWPSGFSRVYSNCCSRCSFEPEIIKNGQWSDMITHWILKSLRQFNMPVQKSLEIYWIHLVSIS